MKTKFSDGDKDVGKNGSGYNRLISELKQENSSDPRMIIPAYFEPPVRF